MSKYVLVFIHDDEELPNQYLVRSEKGSQIREITCAEIHDLIFFTDPKQAQKLLKRIEEVGLPDGWSGEVLKDSFTIRTEESFSNEEVAKLVGAE